MPSRASARVTSRPAVVTRAEAPLRIAGELAHQIEDVGAEDHEIVAARARIFLAAAAQFEQLADGALGDALLGQFDQRRDAHLVGDGELCAGAPHMASIWSASAGVRAMGLSI